MAAVLDPLKPATAQSPVASTLSGMSDNLFGSTAQPAASIVAPKDPTKVTETPGFLPANPTPASTPVPASTPAPASPMQPAIDTRSVETRVNGLIQGDSDYIKTAEARGLADANKRGLVNSSIARGAARGAAIDRALAIATADAQLGTQWQMAREGQGSQMALLEKQLASAEGQQKTDILAQMDRLKVAGQQALGLQGAQDTGAMDRLKAQLSGSDRQQDKDLAGQLQRLDATTAAQMAQLQTQLTHADAQQQTEIRAQMDRLQADSANQSARLAQAAGYDMSRLTTQAGFDIARDAASATNAQELEKVRGSIQATLQAQGNTEQMQRMTLDLQNQLHVQDRQLTNDLSKISAAGNEDIRRLVEAANQERVTLAQSIAGADRQKMADAMVNIFQVEAQMRAALLSNTTIPAAERAQYEGTISGMGDPIRQYINQLYGSSPGLAPSPATVPAGTVTNPGGTPALPGAPVVTAPVGTGNGLSPQTATQVPATALNDGGVPAPGLVNNDALATMDPVTRDMLLRGGRTAQGALQ